MKRLLLVSACLGALWAAACIAQETALEKANQLELQGQFKAAAAVLTEALQNRDAPAAQRKQLEFELDRLDRIKKDFPLTKQQLLSALQKSVQGLSSQEYDDWIKEGR